jgi:hypothetical protein
VGHLVSAAARVLARPAALLREDLFAILEHEARVRPDVDAVRVLEQQLAVGVEQHGHAIYGGVSGVIERTVGDSERAVVIGPELVLEAFVFRNNVRSITPANRYLRVSLEGSGMNRFAIGSRVTLFGGAEQLVQELSPTRGFQSSVEYPLTFGVGAHATAPPTAMTPTATNGVDQIA